MKTVFFFLACTCLINGLTASFVGYPLEDDEANFDNEILPQHDIFFPEDGNAENLIVPFPTSTGRPAPTTPEPTSTTTRRPRPTTTTTTRRPIPTTTTTTRRPVPTTTTTTRRPFPTTTRRPRPTTTRRPRPELERIQIYNNAVRSLGPLAGRLVNVVLNKGRSQKTMQENDILYNLRVMRGNGRYLEEDNDF